MAHVFKTVSEVKRYLVWIPNAPHQNYKQYDTVIDILKDLEDQAANCNILDTLNAEWLILEDS